MPSGQLRCLETATPPRHGAGGGVPCHRQCEDEKAGDQCIADPRVEHREPEDVKADVLAEHGVTESPSRGRHRMQRLPSETGGEGCAEPEAQECRCGQHRPQDVSLGELLGDLQVPEAASDLYPTQRRRRDLQVVEDEDADDHATEHANAALPDHASPEHAEVAGLCLPQHLYVERRQSAPQYAHEGNDQDHGDRETTPAKCVYEVLTGRIHAGFDPRTRKAFLPSIVRGARPRDPKATHRPRSGSLRGALLSGPRSGPRSPVACWTSSATPSHRRRVRALRRRR